MGDENLDVIKPSVRPAPAKAQLKVTQAKAVEAKQGYDIPKELLDDLERSDKMIRDNNIRVVLIIGPNTPTEKQIALPSVARAIKAKFTA